MSKAEPRRPVWNFHPELPIVNAPVIVWPPRPPWQSLHRDGEWMVDQ